MSKIVDHLKIAKNILFVTGAGMSADSGLPTYRGVGGLYNGKTEEGFAIEDMLSKEVFRQHPEWTWKYLRQIEEACRGAKHNNGHAVIAAMEKAFRVCVLTQNVDGFHRKAGSENVIPIHGDLYEIRCTSCSFCETVNDYTHLGLLPRCVCGSVLRPDVVLFGESLPETALTELREQLDKGFDMVFSVGTTSVFHYIAYPVKLIKPSVEINPGTTSVTSIVTYKLKMTASVALTAIWGKYNETD